MLVDFYSCIISMVWVVVFNIVWKDNVCVWVYYWYIVYYVWWVNGYYI